MTEKIKQFLNNPKSYYLGSDRNSALIKGFDFDSQGYANGSGCGYGFAAVEGLGIHGHGDGGGHGAGYCINGRGGNMERRYGGIKYIQLKED